MKSFLIYLVIAFTSIVRAEDERIWCPDVRINGERVHMAFDTGVDVPVLIFSQAAQRIGLKILPGDLDYPIKPNQIRSKFTEPCNLQIGTKLIRAKFCVIDMAVVSDGLDGLFGWPMANSNLFKIDAFNNMMVPLTNAPEDPSWIKLKLATNINCLNLETIDEKGGKGIFSIDTGNPSGLKIAPELWNLWKEAHTNQPLTLLAYYSPAVGIVVKEEAWAEHISLGPFTLTNVSISEADQNDINIGTAEGAKYVATLGLQALKGLEIIVDGKNGCAYIRPKKILSKPISHNRIGAVFVPRDLQGNDLVAHVLNGSPAYEAGVREGDLLLKKDGQDVTNWRTSNIKINTSFEELSAGSKIELTLLRSNVSYTTTVVLRNIIGPTHK